MILIHGQDEVICDWLARVHGAFVVQTPRQVLGVIDRDGILRGAFVITWHHDRTAELSLYGETSNDTFREMFRAVFEAWGIYRIEVRTTRRNKAIKRAAPRFGFKFEGVQKDFYGPGDDALCYFMTPENCRWLKDNDRTGRTAQSAQV